MTRNYPEIIFFGRECPQMPANCHKCQIDLTDYIKKASPLWGLNPNVRIGFNKPERSVNVTLLFLRCRQISCFWRQTDSMRSYAPACKFGSRHCSHTAPNELGRSQRFGFERTFVGKSLTRREANGLPRHPSSVFFSVLSYREGELPVAVRR